MPKKPINTNKPSFDELAKRRIPKDKLNLVLLIGLCLLLISGGILFFFGTNNYFWLLLVIGIIIVANSLWLRKSFSMPFGLPFVITMLRTKHFINFIKSVSYHAYWFEKVCLVGMILGFGLTGVDYWYARRLGGAKRILLLIFSGIALSSFYYFFLSILFSVPILAPLYIPCLIGFVLLGFGGLSLVMLIGYGVLSLIGLFAAKQLCPALAPVIPGVPIPGIGVAIPFIAWISLALVLILHELSHGIMMAYYKEKIKSVGLLVAGVFPIGAFVEQDNETFNKLEDKKALMVLSAGSAMNIFCILIAVLLFISIGLALKPIGSIYESEYNKTFSGIRVVAVSETVSFCGVDVNAPAKGKLFVGDIVKSINGVDVNNPITLNKEFTKSDGNISFVVERKIDGNKLVDVNVFIQPHKFEDLGLKRIGVEFGLIDTGYKIDSILILIETGFSLLLQVIFFFGLLCFAAGTFNYFPSDPFDGGKMAKIILAPYFGFLGFNKKETQKFIGRLFFWLLIISIILNLIPYLTMLI